MESEFDSGTLLVEGTKAKVQPSFKKIVILMLSNLGFAQFLRHWAEKSLLHADVRTYAHISMMLIAANLFQSQTI